MYTYSKTQTHRHPVSATVLVVMHLRVLPLPFPFCFTRGGPSVAISGQVWDPVVSIQKTARLKASHSLNLGNTKLPRPSLGPVTFWLLVNYKHSMVSLPFIGNLLPNAFLVHFNLLAFHYLCNISPFMRVSYFIYKSTPWFYYLFLPALKRRIYSI